MSNSLVRTRARRVSPQDVFTQWVVRAALRDSEQGHLVGINLAHGRIGQRHSQHLESWDVDPNTASSETATNLAAELWAAAEGHAETLGLSGPQRYDITALYGEERNPLAQTSIRIEPTDKDADIIEGSVEPPSPAGWLAQTMRHREMEMRARQRLENEALAVIRAASEMTRNAGVVFNAEVEKQRLILEEADRARRFQVEQEERAERRRAQERKEQIEAEERNARHAIELKSAESKAVQEHSSLETKQKAMEQGLDLLKIFAPLAVHRVATHFGGGSLPVTDNELLNAARLRGFFQTLDPTDVAKMADALGGSSPKAMGFLDLLSSVMFGSATKAKDGDVTASATTTPSAEPAASDEPAPSPLAQSFIEALRQAFAEPRTDGELALLRARIQQQLANQHPLADVEAVARFVERAGYTQIADLFQEHIRARRTQP